MEEEEWCLNLGVLCSTEAINTKARLGPVGFVTLEVKWFSYYGTADRVILPAQSETPFLMQQNPK